MMRPWILFADEITLLLLDTKSIGRLPYTQCSAYRVRNLPAIPIPKGPDAVGIM